jgi:hypothetical protein
VRSTTTICGDRPEEASMKGLTTAVVTVLLATLGFTATAGAKPTTLRASLTGVAETPAGAPNGSAKVTVTLDSSKRKVCWKFTGPKGVTGPNAAHIHQGEKGKAGAIVVPFGATFKSKGCQTKVAKAAIKQILAHPSLYYVNIHNSAFPAGAVRGQLKR